MTRKGKQIDVEQFLRSMNHGDRFGKNIKYYFRLLYKWFNRVTSQRIDFVAIVTVIPFENGNTNTKKVEKEKWTNNSTPDAYVFVSILYRLIRRFNSTYRIHHELVESPCFLFIPLKRVFPYFLLTIEMKNTILHRFVQYFDQRFYYNFVFCLGPCWEKHRAGMENNYYGKKKNEVSKYV